MSRLLPQLDPSLPPRMPSPGASSSSDDSAPATPSKDKMREWTFPRQLPQGGLPSSQSSQPARYHNLVDGAHGRSSSVTPGHGAKGARTAGAGGGNESMDLRHRSNASLAVSPSSPLLPRLLPGASAPKDVAKLVYSNVRHRSLHDVAYFVFFGGALFLFATALLGVGYDAAARPRSSAAAVRAVRATGEALGPVDVKLPAGFLPTPGAAHAARAADKEEFLADVHQPIGDSSHDAGAEHFSSSPDDPALSDEHVHEHHPPAEPLWPEDPAHLEHEAEAAAQPRPRPARLPLQADEAEEVDADAGEAELDAEEAQLVALVGAHEDEGEEHEELDVVYEGEEAPAADEEDAEDEMLVVDEGEPEEDLPSEDEDENTPVSPGGLHVVDGDDDDAAASSLSALEELLDSAEKEEAAARATAAGADADAARDSLARAQRGREALARVQAKAPAVERRMVRAKKARR
ncbi:hypothetical protein JCM3770_005317 [Rhodotorula araucariae]